MFPALCFTDVSNGIIDEEAEKNLENNLSNEEINILHNNSTKIKFKFKIIELLNGNIL